MPQIELEWEDMRDIATNCVAPGAAQLLDLLDGNDLEDVLIEAAGVRDAAQAIIDGRVQA